MKECIFCKLIKEKDSKITFENDIVIIKPLNPINKDHILISPEKHFENIYDIPENLLSKVMIKAKETSKKIKSDGINILHASGEVAQQSVFHFHIHIIPRYKNDGLDLWIKNSL